MENNVELIKSLFVDIDPSIINNDKLDIKDTPACPVPITVLLVNLFLFKK